MVVKLIYSDSAVIENTNLRFNNEYHKFRISEAS